jgi:hypothetical protein
VRLYVFRSLPLSADSRTKRNAECFKEQSATVCTWEKEKKFVSEDDNLTFPFCKSGSTFIRAMKYLLFLLWVPYVILCRTKKGDVVIFMDLETIIFGGLAAKLKSVKVIFDIVDPFAQTKRSIKPIARLFDYVERGWANLADLVMVPHLSRVDYYSEVIGKSFRTDHLLVVENVPDYRNCEKVSKNKDLATSFSIGYFGTLDRDTRGLERLISLGQKFPQQLKLIFAGQGGLSEELKLLAENNDNISFSGGFDASTLPLLYKNVDFTWAYYCPKITLHKYAAPNKYYEHIFFQTPLITSSIIPQSSQIKSLNSGFFIDLEKDTDQDIMLRLLQYVQDCHMKDSELFEFWNSHYEGYYKNCKTRFKGKLVK